MSKGLKIGLMITGGVAVAALLLGAGIALGGAMWRGAGWPAGVNQMHPAWASDEGFGWGSGMIGFSGRNQGSSGGFGSGMMGGYGGMMGATGAFGADPLTLEQAETALDGYLARLGDEDLRLGEIMIFDNHAYAQIVEDSTGIGALEVLVDPLTLAVYPEHGPNMMWNLKYGGMGGMMGGFAGAA